MKTLVRIAMIAVAASVFVGLTAVYVRYSPPERHRRFEEFRRRRPSGPAMRDSPSFVGEFLLVGGIALVGRKVLRVKL
jgi:hypothetical protein